MPKVEHKPENTVDPYRFTRVMQEGLVIRDGLETAGFEGGTLVRILNGVPAPKKNIRKEEDIQKKLNQRRKNAQPEKEWHGTKLYSQDKVRKEDIQKDAQPEQKWYNVRLYSQDIGPLSTIDGDYGRKVVVSDNPVLFKAIEEAMELLRKENLWCASGDLEIYSSQTGGLILGFRNDTRNDDHYKSIYTPLKNPGKSTAADWVQGQPYLERDFHSGHNLKVVRYPDNSEEERHRLRLEELTEKTRQLQKEVERNGNRGISQREFKSHLEDLEAERQRESHARAVREYKEDEERNRYNKRMS